MLEVTETAAVVDLDCARRTLERLAALGVTLALDDFGTGYSSLSHVHALPFQILKVDRSFVSACREGDRRAVAMIAAVGALARQISVDVVAEGVEHDWELPALRALGCGYAQGFGLSRPRVPERGGHRPQAPGSRGLAPPTCRGRYGRLRQVTHLHPRPGAAG